MCHNQLDSIFLRTFIGNELISIHLFSCHSATLYKEWIFNEMVIHLKCILQCKKFDRVIAKCLHSKILCFLKCLIYTDDFIRCVVLNGFLVI